MRVCNIMLSRIKGGLEQCFLDYQKCLELNNIETIIVTSKKAYINDYVNSHQLMNFGSWDIFSIYKLKSILSKFNPEIIIAHGDRAIKFALKARLNTSIKIVGVTHNYKNKLIRYCDYIFATTKHLKSYFSSYLDHIFLLPNMTDVTKEYKKPMYHNPIVIGTYGRFVKKKGFHVLLEAANILKESNCDFKVIIGGQGEEAKNLEALCYDLDLNNYVNFVGWINNRDKFFQDIDIFCMPSLHEPFGISLLEAMAHSTPVVATMSEGPSQIIRDNKNGILAQLNNAKDLAAKLKILIENEEFAQNLSYNAYFTVKTSYNIETNSHLLNKHLIRIKSYV